MVFRIRLQSNLGDSTRNFRCTLIHLFIPALRSFVVFKRFLIDQLQIRLTFLGADNFPLVLFGVAELVTFLEGHSSALCPLPPKFQQVVFTTKPESWVVEGEFQDPFSIILYRSVLRYEEYLQDHRHDFQYECYTSWL